MKKMLCLIMTLMFLIHPFSIGNAESETDVAFRVYGVLERGTSNASVLEHAAFDAPKLASLSSGNQCLILGQESSFYRILLNGVIGYVHKAKLVLAAEQAGDTNDIAPRGIGLYDYLTEPKEEKYLPFVGSLESDQPLDGIIAVVWDQRRLLAERIIVRSFDSSQYNIASDVLAKLVPTEGLKGGRKTLEIQGISNDKIIPLYRTLLYIRGATADAIHVTNLCHISSPTIEYGWSPSEKMPALTIEIPKEANAAIMTMEWKKPPEFFTLEKYDEDGQIISSEDKSTGFFADWTALDASVRKVRIIPVGKRCTLTDLKVYADNYHPQAVQQWNPIPEKVDLMVFSTHQDDELLFFGGTIPYYSSIGAAVAVVYMTDCGRDRYREALEGLWCCGLKTHPIFLGYRDALVESIDVAYSLWREQAPYETMVRLLRKYRPEVIVTHDFDGEYGHTQHRLTAKMVSEVIKMANDPDFDPESALEYGVWEVKKVYIHLYPDNQVTINWETPIGESLIETPMFLAREAFDKHLSQQADHVLRMINNFTYVRNDPYDCRLFGLYYTAVGPDVEKNDFFENIH